MILPQDNRPPVEMKLEVEPRLHDKLTAYAQELSSGVEYTAKEIWREYLATANKSAKRNGSGKKGKKT